MCEQCVCAVEMQKRLWCNRRHTVVGIQFYRFLLPYANNHKREPMTHKTDIYLFSLRDE